MSKVFQAKYQPVSQLPLTSSTVVSPSLTHTRNLNQNQQHHTIGIQTFHNLTSNRIGVTAVQSSTTNLLKWAGNRINCRLINTMRRRGQFLLVLNLALFCVFIFSIGHFMDNKEQLRHRMDAKFTQINSFLNKGASLTSKYLILNISFCNFKPPIGRKNVSTLFSNNQPFNLTGQEDRYDSQFINNNQIKKKRFIDSSSFVHDKNLQLSTSTHQQSFTKTFPSQPLNSILNPEITDTNLFNTENSANWNIYLNKNITNSTSELLYEMLIGVVSKVDNFQRRIVIRATWGQYARENGALVLFILARSRDVLINKRVEEEHQRYGDILQLQFDEDYYNLTLKSVALLKYAVSYCFQAKHVLKIDDDVLPNWLMLEQNFEKIQPKNSSSYVICTTYNESEPIRDPSSKWYTPLGIYSSKRFPNYCSGPAYLMSIDAVKRLLAHIHDLDQIFYLEDVFVTGMLRSFEPKIMMINVPYFLNNRPIHHYCDSREHLFHHNMNSQTMLKFWPWTVVSKCHRPWYGFIYRFF